MKLWLSALCYVLAPLDVHISTHMCVMFYIVRYSLYIYKAICIVYICPLYVYCINE